MALKQTLAPTHEPVTLDQAKEHLIVQHAEDDLLIESLIRSARKLVEGRSARQLIVGEWTLYLDKFPCGEIELRVCPVVDVEVKYVDPAGVEQVLDFDAYQVDAASEPGRIAPAYGLSWPATRCQMNAVQITFRAGYVDPDDIYAELTSVPETAIEAILLLIGHWYEHREAVGQVGQEIALAFEACMDDLRWSLW